MKAEEARERAKARALRLLEKRDYSKAELAAKSSKAGEDPAEAGAVSERMAEFGFVNDENYAGMRGSKHSRGASGRPVRCVTSYAPRACTTSWSIRLRRRRDDGADLQAAQALVAKRLPSLQRLDHQARYRRLAGQLARRGFGPGVISTVLRDLPRAGDDAPDPDPFAT